MTEENIAIELFYKYYERDNTPLSLVSSYWKEMHQKSDVRIVDGRIFLKGFAFGDMQQVSLPLHLFSWATIASYLFHINNRFAVIKMMGPAVRVTARMGLPFTYDCFRQVCSLALMTGSWNVKASGRQSILCIGDGYGFLSCLVKELFPKTRVIFVDLGKTLLFQAYFSERAFPDCKHILVGDAAGASLISDADFVYCAAEDLRYLDSEFFDAAINIASMQEMNHGTVKGYFEFMRGHLRGKNLFYCCNRREKIMPGGEVSSIANYPWKEEDRFLIDGRCPWHKYFFSPHATAKGYKLFGVRVPFINFFDGEVVHRLAVLTTINNYA